jgi:ABC-type nitrate/sulfonate/bicarbonate transport system substrate-binding protein
MKRVTLLVIALLMVLAIAGCGSSAKNTSSSGASSEATSTEATTGLAPGDENRPYKMVSKDKMYLQATKSYNAADFPKTAMTGEPSNISYFKPTADEGILNRVYPSYDSKTYKFLDLMNQCLAPQWYYMFHKNGGTLNKAVASTGYKFADILDSGHTKIMPNLMLGYYDFAWVAANQLTELWGGNVTQYSELWRGGSDYVIVGASYDGGSDLLASPSITSVKQLAGKIVGIMNVSLHSESNLNKVLSSVGLSTASAGGNVNVEMGTPGFIMNDLITKKDAAAFVWGKYTAQLESKFGFKTLMKWQDMGYGTKVPSLFLIVRKDIIKYHPEIVQAVVQANYDATKKAVSDGDFEGPNLALYTAYWKKYYGVKPNVVTPTRSLIDAQANPSYLHDVIDYMTKCGYFKTPYTYSELVDESFYANVKK